MSFGEAISSCFGKYATFGGRAPRSEYWYWVLFGIIVGMGTVFVHPILNQVMSLALLLPGIAVTVRRLHDVGKSGWWYLIIFTCIGVIPLLIWMCKEGDEATNEFGDNPLGSPMSGEPPVQPPVQ